MEKNAKIYVAGHRGLVGSAAWRGLERHGYTNLTGRTHAELDLGEEFEHGGGQQVGGAVAEDEQPLRVVGGQEAERGVFGQRHRRHSCLRATSGSTLVALRAGI